MVGPRAVRLDAALGAAHHQRRLGYVQFLPVTHDESFPLTLRQAHQLLFNDFKNLSTLKPGVATGEPTRSLSQAMDLLTQAIQYTRTLTSELSPPVLYDLGLGAALRWLAGRIDVDVEHSTPEQVLEARECGRSS